MSKTAARVPFRTKSIRNLEAGAGFLLGCLLLHLGVYGTHGFGGSWCALFPPAFHSRTMLFEVGESQRVLEHYAEGGNDGLEAFPNDPLLAGILEEEFIVDEIAIDNARDHFPIADHHAHEGILLASGRAHRHQ